MNEVCERCGVTEWLQQHHISYTPSITQCLCVDCHMKVHGYKHGVGASIGNNIKVKGNSHYMQRRIQSDNRLLLTSVFLNKANMITGEKVQVSTGIGSGKIVIERMKKGGEN